MINYQTVKLSDIMPENLLADGNIAACCTAIDGELSKVAKLCSTVLLISRIDELSEEVIDLLAWQWHVDFYDNDYDLATKRKLVKQSIAWHRRKGTPSVVQEAVAAVLEDATVSENWEYGGDAYCFRVQSVAGDMPGAETFDRLVKNISAVKNTRSHLDGVSFYRALNDEHYVGTGIGSMYKGIVIGMPKFRAPQIKMGNNNGVATVLHKTITIGE